MLHVPVISRHVDELRVTGDLPHGAVVRAWIYNLILIGGSFHLDSFLTDDLTRAAI